MATDTVSEQSTIAARYEALSTRKASPEAAPRRNAPRRGRWLLLIGLAAAISTAVLVGAPYLSGSEELEAREMHRREVQRGDLLITVTEDGNVESAMNVEVKCQVAGGSTILWIIPDGTLVKKGDELVRLDASAIEDAISQQRIVYEKSLATRIEAEKTYSSAKLAVDEYTAGTYVKELQLVDAQITIAMENLRSAENTLQHTERMARKGYVTPLQLEAQQFAVRRSQLDLETAETAKMALEKFTRLKMANDLESLRDSAEARMRSEQAACDLEKSRLDRLMEQLEQSIISAPQDGMVIYANEINRGRGGGTGVTIEEGALVRERQTIIRLPDLSQMQVKVNVHESKVDRLVPGMRARVTVQGRDFRGEVRSVANQPEPTSWFSSNVKEYATIVRIDGTSEGLRPGLTAEVEILVANLSDVLSVPVQAVVEQGSNFNCYVLLPSGKVERRPVLLGASNNTQIEIKDGLSPGEVVITNPRTSVPAAREAMAVKRELDVAGTFGSDGPSAMPPAGGTLASEYLSPSVSPVAVESKAGDSRTSDNVHATVVGQPEGRRPGRPAHQPDSPATHQHPTSERQVADQQNEKPTPEPLNNRSDSAGVISSDL